MSFFKTFLYSLVAMSVGASVDAQVTTPNYPSRTTGGRIDSTRIRNAIENESNVSAEIYVQMIKQYRLRVHAAHHVAQSPIYLKQEKADLAELANYAEIAKHVVKLQEFIFYNGDSIFILTFTGNQTNDTINRRKYTFLEKVLSDYQINTEGPFKRVDINDTLQFLNNLREFLDLPLRLKYSYPRELNQGLIANVPSGKLDEYIKNHPDLGKPELALKNQPVKPPSATAKAPASGMAKPTQSELNSPNPPVDDGSQLVALLPLILQGDAPSRYKLIDGIKLCKTISAENLGKIEQVLSRLAQSGSYTATADYAKFLLAKSKLNVDGKETAVQAGAYLLLADKIGVEKENNGAFLFDSYFREQPEEVKSSAKAAFESLVKSIK
jgi:hypothetical protein